MIANPKETAVPAPGALASDSCLAHQRDRGLICLSVAGGTMGDARPLIALGLALRRRGYAILMVGNCAFERTARRAGVAASEWFNSSHVPQSFQMRTTSGQRWLWGGRRRYRDRWMLRELAAHRRERMAAWWRRVGRDNPRVVAAIGSISAWEMLEGFRPQCPKVVSCPMPYQPSIHVSLDPPDITRFERLKGRIRRHTRAAAFQRFSEERFHLVSASPSLFPRPDDWLSNMQVTGYMSLDEGSAEWAPPQALTAFLDDGPPPVYVGFGSYPFLFGERGERLALQIAEGCRRRGVRCIMQSPDLPLSPRSTDVFILDGDVPHAWLFPRCAAVVHHGGYGSVHAALTARRPMVIYPFQTDQFLWAARMGELGAGPGFTARLRNLTADRLAADLATVLKSDCLSAADRLGAALATEQGLATQLAAVESIIEHAATGQRPLAWRAPHAAAFATAPSVRS